MVESGGTTISLNLAAPEEPVKEKVSVFAHNNSNNQEVREKEVNKKDGEKQQQQQQHDEDKEVISSLFGHNPEIPTLELGQVNPVQEDVFSARTFSELPLNPHLIQNLKHHGIITLTNIQSKALPVIMGGKDALIKSQTGSGKTLTYAIPILQQLSEQVPRVSRTDGCYALVVVPTRELAVQTFEWFQKLCRAFVWIVPGILTGGEDKKSEKARLRKGVNVLVTTPGRLIDHIQKTESLKLDKVKWVILDEADRMLELGYERDVQTVLNALQEKNDLKRQSVLLSATLTTGIQQLSEVSLRHPTFVDAADTPGDVTEESIRSLVIPENLTQTFLLVPAKLRLVALGAFMFWKCQQGRGKKMLVFLATQDMVDFYTEALQIVFSGVNHEEEAEEEEEDEDEMTEEAKLVLGSDRLEKKPSSGAATTTAGLDSSIKLLKLHGNMGQKERVNVFKEFRTTDSGILMCTDVASRGLDLPQVDWIVQFTAPISTSDYVHRVGRTARIGKKGSSVLFLLPSEAGFVKQLEQEEFSLAEITLDRVLDKLCKSGITSTNSGLPARNMEEAATNLQMRIENSLIRSKNLHQLASQAYVSFVRSYASYPKEIRNVFCFKDLHLGHCAKSFALRDPPSKITGLGKGNWVKNEERKQQNVRKEENIIKAQKRRINQKALIMSEYASGMDSQANQAKKAKKEAKIAR